MTKELCIHSKTPGRTDLRWVLAADILFSLLDAGAKATQQLTCHVSASVDAINSSPAKRTPLPINLRIPVLFFFANVVTAIVRIDSSLIFGTCQPPMPRSMVYKASVLPTTLAC